MTHYCTACLNEFDDDGEPLPHASCVHCVFCGAKIPLRRRSTAGSPLSVVPFSKDYEREEAFALGIITGSGPGFPDTLRQFRVRAARNGDSLAPVAQGSEPPPPITERARRRFGTFGVPLAGGFAVGVALAFGTVAMRHDTNAAVAAAAPAQDATPPRALPPEKVAPVAAPAAVPLPGCQVAASAPMVAAAVVRKVATNVNVVPDRRWYIDRARAEQRQYHLSAAERYYRQALVQAPRDSEALSGLGELELLRGTLDVAATRFQEALQVNADYIPALVAAADIRWESGQAQEARQAYRNIVDQYSADSYPPYVAKRSVETAFPPQCER
jgi:hypothetical protein